MKYLFLVIIAICVTASFSVGQTPTVKAKYYDSWYYFRSNVRKPVIGIPYEFGDTIITVIPKDDFVSGISQSSTNRIIIPVRDVDKMYFRKTGQKGTALAVGIILGSAAGLVFGITHTDVKSSDDFVQSMSVIGVVFSTVAGAGLGVAISLPLGSIKKIVRIHGEPDIYRQIRPDLIKYSISYYN